MGTSPTKRTMAHFRRKKWDAEKVEYWNAAAQQSHDLLGFGDVLVFDADRHRLLILQVTSYSNIAARVKKIKTIRRRIALKWLDFGGLIEVWGWKEYDKTAMDGDFIGRRWRPRIVPINRSDLSNDQKTLEF